MSTPRAEVEIDEPLVKALLHDQFPDIAGLPVVAVAEGWDNKVFRLGDDMTVRLPRREVADDLVMNEHRWGAELVDGLDLGLGVAVPSRLGEPGRGYGWHWTIGPWFAGQSAEVSPPEDPLAAAATLGTFLARIHRPAPEAAPESFCRGVALASRAEAFHKGLTSGALDDVARVDRARLVRLWEKALEVPVFDGVPVWLHGDVYPLNLIVEAGALSAVIDLGDLCAGDPASDLAVGWMLFDADARHVFRSAACPGRASRTGQVDARDRRWHDLWCRAWGWALALGVAMATGDDRVREIGLRTLRSALDAPPGPIS